MDTVVSLEPEIEEDLSGTNELPLLIGIAESQGGRGHRYYTNISNKYQTMTLRRFGKQKSDGSQDVTLRCSDRKCGGNTRLRNSFVKTVIVAL